MINKFIKLDTRAELIATRGELSNDVGFVPTMGNLHLGHLSLVEAAANKHKHVFVSIFVNPKQFGPNEDFEKYPRTINDDLEKLNEVAAKYPSNKFYLFAPLSINEIYPFNFQTTIKVNQVTQGLCGKDRPTHFEGVTTVVYLLFSLVKPQTAYFGQKDYQQCVVVRQMVDDLNLDLKIAIMPIVRDHDGLALSSRNQYLSTEDRKNALYLFRSLERIQDLLLTNFDRAIDLKETILDEKKWEYLEILNALTLENATSNDNEVVIVGAIKFGHTRLLDNILVKL